MSNIKSHNLAYTPATKVAVKLDTHKMSKRHINLLLTKNQYLISCNCGNTIDIPIQKHQKYGAPIYNQL